MALEIFSKFHEIYENFKVEIFTMHLYSFLSLALLFLLFPSLSFLSPSIPFPSHFPSCPLPPLSYPLIAARGSGEALKAPPVGSGAKPQPPTILVLFYAENSILVTFKLFHILALEICQKMYENLLKKAGTFT
jgi:hypothetical protein